MLATKPRIAATVATGLFLLWVWLRIQVAFFGPYSLPPYEPIQAYGGDAATPAQKESAQAVENFAVSAMDHHHVSVRKFNQFQWQMHFFVPVHYKPFKCSLLDQTAPLAKRKEDIIAMGEAMQEAHNAFPTTFPMQNAKAVAARPSNDGKPDLTLDENDDLQLYGAVLWSYMFSYAIHYKDVEEMSRGENIGWFGGYETDLRDGFFDPYNMACSSTYLNYINVFSDNRRYIEYWHRIWGRSPEDEAMVDWYRRF